MKVHTVIIKTYLKSMVEYNDNKDGQIKDYYDKVLIELELVKFIEPNNLKDFDLLFKNFIKATIKNFLYEQSEENRNSTLDLLAFLNSFKVVGE